MEKRQMIILCTIGSKNINFKSVTEIKVDRNFSDVGNKFSIDLIDSPEVTTYDLELYMNAGYRDIVFKYGDLNSNKLSTYKGTIWDYTSTFVGNIKKLTITGICDRYTGNKYSASTYLYNIDWNSYYNIREDEELPYGVLSASNMRANLSTDSSPILNPAFGSTIRANSKKLKLKGPSGQEIQLPIPDSFFNPFDASGVPNEENETTRKNSQYAQYFEIINDTKSKYWGPLHRELTTQISVICPFPSIDNANKKYFDGNNLMAVKCEIDSTSYLYVKYSWLANHSSLDSPNLYDNDAAYMGIFGPLKNKRETFAENSYVNVYDKNGALVGFRGDNNENAKDKDVYLCFPLYKYANAMVLWANQDIREVNIEDNTTSGSMGNLNYWYWYDRDNKLRAFLDRGNSGQFYVQANPSSSGYGAAGLLKSGEGNDISWIVKQLCILEGWKYKDEYIVQTELVPFSDAFKMQNQSAIEFIQKNLIPKAITPIGRYKTTDDERIFVDKPQGGFGLFFDKDGYFHFQPLSQTSLEYLNIPNLGYNIPNTPTISFQINTKGTAFYTFQPKTITATSITSGVEVKDVEVVSEAVEEEVRKTLGHNDTFDDWLGLKYETVQEAVNKSNILEGYDENGATKSFSISYNENYVSIGNQIRDIAYGLAQNALVTSPTTKLVASGVYNVSDIQGNISKAVKQIEDFTITANMTMWGDYRIKPAGIIKIINMVKGGQYNSNIPQKHPSSGDYLIQKVSETVSSSGYVQSLDLLRFTGDLDALINPYKIDYSVAAEVNASDIKSITYTEPGETYGGGGGGGHGF